MDNVISDYKYLSRINSPEDVRKLNDDELNILAAEIRYNLIQVVAQNGRHLAPNL